MCRAKIGRVCCCVAVLGFLSGCGGSDGGTSTTTTPDIENTLRLNKESVTVAVTGNRAVISGNGTRTLTFADFTLPRQSQIRQIRHQQRLSRSLVVTVPPGATYPASFQLRNIVLDFNLSDQTPDNTTRRFATVLSISGPVTFTREAETQNYTASGTLAFSELDISNEYANNPLDAFRAIVSTPGSPNTIQIRLSLDAEDTQLPNGSTLTFQFVDGSARILL